MKSRSLSRTCGLLVLVVFGLVHSPSHAAHAANLTLTVDTPADASDTGHRMCTAAADDCSLRGAILNANADPGNSYTITLPAGTYSLVSGQLYIDSSITLNGAGQATTIISEQISDRVIQVNAFRTVTITGVTVSNGHTPDSSTFFTPGAGIYNTGTLYLSDSTITNNRTGNGTTPPAGVLGVPGGSSPPGGGIYNTGNLALNNVTVTFNHTGNGGNGAWGANATVTPPAGIGGTGGLGGNGAGIYNSGVATITLSFIGSNITGTGGAGGNGLDGVRDTDGSGLPAGSGGNGGNAGDGGGIYNSGHLTLVQTTVQENRTGDGGQGGNGGQALDGLIESGWGGSGGSGGNGGAGGAGGNGSGIYSNGTITITSSTIAANTAGHGRSGGTGGNAGNGANYPGAPGDGGDAGSGGNGGAGGAGALYLMGTGASLVNASIIWNSAWNGGNGGDRGTRGLGGEGGLEDGGPGLQGSIGTGGTGSAGGLLNKTTASINSSTITSNIAGAGGYNGTGTVRAGGGSGGGIASLAGSSTIANTIVSGNSIYTDGTPQAQGPDCFGGLNSQGYNLFGNTAGCSIFGLTSGNLVTPADLGTLGSHGGPTQTQVPNFSSPAIDAGNGATPGSGPWACPTSDARGNPRGDFRCDIGAVEVQLTDTSMVQKCNIGGMGLVSFGPTLVTFQITNPGSLTCMTVNRVDVSHPHAPPWIQTGRFWSISANGTVWNAYLGLVAPVADPSIARVARYTGTGYIWDSARFGNAGSLVTRGGIMDPSGEWAVDNGFKYLMLPLIDK